MLTNPIHRPGTKNALCPHYEQCLDYAVQRYWKYWDCSECAHKESQESVAQEEFSRDAERKGCLEPPPV